MICVFQKVEANLSLEKMAGIMAERYPR